jgi:polyhydroxyalkanoate synthesis regulator phasin
MALQDNLVENLLDTQKKVLDSVVESTKKFTGNNTMINETIEKGNDWYKNLLETQKAAFNKVTGQAEKATETTKENATKVNEFYEQWYSTQMNWAKQIFELGQQSVKNMGNTQNNANPFAQWQNYMSNMTGANSNPMTQWMNNMSNMNGMNWNNNPMMANMTSFNPFDMDAAKKMQDNMASTFNGFYQNLNQSFATLQQYMQNGTVQDVYKNMIASGEGFTKFAEIWMPMFKSMQDKTFNMDMYKQMMNPELYKEFMDKFFGFMPEQSRQQFTDFTNMMTANMKNSGNQAFAGFQQMKGMMNNGMNPHQMFAGMNSAFNNMNSMMSEAVAPFTKMMPQNAQTKAMQEWNDISQRIAAYNIKNAELQYMVYNQGVKVTDALAESIAKKMNDGTEITSLLGLYQEWLNIGDKVFVSLFESSEYSQLMAEVSAMKMRLQKDIELQSEKMLAEIPVATRSEMDETSKVIYELKKRVRQLERMMDASFNEDTTEATEEATEEKPATKRASKKA